MASGGNPYHDGRGKFTDKGHDGSGNVNPVSKPTDVSTGSHAATKTRRPRQQQAPSFASSPSGMRGR